MNEDHESPSVNSRQSIAAQIALVSGAVIACGAALALNVWEGLVAQRHPRPPTTLGVIASENEDLAATSNFEILERLALSGPHSLAFSRGAIGERLLNVGWFDAEEWGVWMSGDKASISLPTKVAGATVTSLRLDFIAFAPPTVTQEFRFSVNGQELGHTSVAPRADTLIPAASMTLTMPANADAAPTTSLVVLEIGVNPPVSPADAGVGPDVRKLAFGLSRIEFNPPAE